MRHYCARYQVGSSLSRGRSVPDDRPRPFGDDGRCSKIESSCRNRREFSISSPKSLFSGRAVMRLFSLKPLAGDEVVLSDALPMACAA